MNQYENQIDNLPQIKLEVDFSVDLSFLADLASTDFSAENMGGYNSVTSSLNSTVSSSSTASPPQQQHIPYYPEDSLINCTPYYANFYATPPPLTPSYTSSVGSSPTASPPPPAQSFFPSNFDADNVWNQHLNNYMASNLINAENNSFQLSSIAKCSLKMKRKRASRSKCPCVKCCSARTNGFPSPINHSCVVKNCSKSYTRPAHLRSHLKTHENQGTLKCDMCSKAFMKAEMLINHMFEHGNEMRLF